MADAILGDRIPVDNSFSSLLNTTDAGGSVRLGLIDHPLLTPDAQVRILATVDKTGNAELGDILAGLGDHVQPVGAVLALVEAGVLALEPDRILDNHSRLSRMVTSTPIIRQRRKNGHGGAAGSADTALPAGVALVPAGCHAPILLYLDGGARLDAAAIPALQRPGIYAAFWGRRVYVGMSSYVGRRISTGGHLAKSRCPDCIVAIVDQHDRLTPALARVAERALALHVDGSPDLELINTIPDGDVIDERAYGSIRLFVGEAALAMRHAGIAFVGGNSRSIVAGPRADADRLAVRLDELPPGQVHELEACGVVAWAVADDEDDWTLLEGSEVRPAVVPSANNSTAVLRTEWLHCGILVHVGGVLKLTCDVKFGSGSAAAHFVLGSKAVGRSGWKPIGDNEPLADPVV